MKKILLTVISVIIILLIIILINKKSSDKEEQLKIKDIRNFELFYTEGYEINSNVRYIIECETICVAKIKEYGSNEEEIKTYDIDDMLINNIIEIFNKYDVIKWDGFNKNNQNVLDGDLFSFTLKTKDNIKVEASGYMMWPNNYIDVKEGIKKIFNTLIEQNK